MTQWSFPFAAETPVANDARPYTDTEWRAFMRAMFLGLGAAGQFLLSADNELAVSAPAANTIRVMSGCALVDGLFYQSDATEDLAVNSAPAGHSRRDRVVLRATWAAGSRQCRLAIKEGGEGSAPALTQTSNTTWELALAWYDVNDAGAISSLTEEVSEDSYIGFGGIIRATEIGTGAVLKTHLEDCAARSVIGRAAGSAGAPADISAAVDGYVLRRSGSTLGFGQVEEAGLQNGAVTNAKLRDSGPRSVIGRAASTTGDPADISASADGEVLQRKAGALVFDKCNADTLDGYHAADILSGGVIVGAIIMWSGALGGSDGHRPIVGGAANEDWHVCNGDTIGSIVTPDLRDRFVVGAGSTYAKGDTGGTSTSSHSHGAGTLAAPLHTHNMVLNNAMEPGAAPVSNENPSGAPSSTAITGSTAASAPSNLPPYYGLYYIMKVA